MEKLRIAQVCPLWESVPPPHYGGIELVVSHLTEELVRRGHQVTLFASGDSQTSAQLESVYPHAIRQDIPITDYRTYGAYELMEIGKVYDRASEFDLIHTHVEFTAQTSANLVKTPTVHTIHFDINPALRQLFSQYRHHPYISISNAQQELAPELNYIATVYNGIDIERYPFVPSPSNPPYLAFLGRIYPEKGCHHAITVAQKTGWRLKIAGKLDLVHKEFFERKVAPHIDGQQIEYLGEINHAEKVELLGNASATLFPITWREPFGLVMIESMCTGTPVIGIKMGSVPEIIVHGKTGLIAYSYEEMEGLIPAALKLNRQSCREYVEQNFSITKMVDGYEAAYEKVLGIR